MSQGQKKVERVPVIAVMGHVDHGKTSFIDYIKGTKIVDKEAGGITQNTRAHVVFTSTGRKLTFIDTPGHEAFSKMRERGASITDFVLLIVAADDGVQPQTVESIQFAKRDNVPIIVGLNKIDIPGVQTQKIKAELSSYGVSIEEYGGDTMLFEISAKTGQGVNELLDGIELLSDLVGLKRYELTDDSKAEAFVLESSFDRRIGYIALCILKSGVLEGKEYGVTKEGIFKARNYLNDEQKPVGEVLPGEPFWVTGLKSVITVGETIKFFREDAIARKYFESLRSKDSDFEQRNIISNESIEDIFAQMVIKAEKESKGLGQKEFNVVLKTSTQGALEVISNHLSSMSGKDSKVNILIKGTGNVTEDDLVRAKLAKAVILTFQLPTPNSIIEIAKKEKVLVKNYDVIYEMFEEVQDVLDNIGTPIEEEIEVAKAQIKKIIVLSNGAVVAGSEVIKGSMLKGYKVKVMRNGVEIGRAKISQLKIKKEEVREVKKGLECGILLDQKIEGMREGDEILAYKVERIN